LLHVGVCCKSLVSQVLNAAKEIKVAAREIRTVERHLAAIALQPYTSPVVSMDPSDFHLF